MNMGMDDSIIEGIMYGEHPPRGVYFTVRVQYNPENAAFAGQMPEEASVESSPIASYVDALLVSDKFAEDITQKSGDTLVNTIEVDPDTHDGYHVYVQDHLQSPLARIGIELFDYREHTIH